MTLYLVGFMGAGKSTVGQLLSDQLQRPFVDLDKEIESKMGISIERIFEQVGEQGFRQIEYDTLQDISEKNDNSIVATGGGIITYASSYKKLLEARQVVYLEATKEVLFRRISSDTANVRPLITGGSLTDFGRLLEERLSRYEEVATWTIHVSNQSVKEVVTSVITNVTGGSI